MANLVSFGNKRSYDEFKKQIPIKIRPFFDSIREFCLSLGETVVEDIRMHRVVFGKTMTFRWFADVAPQENSITIKIQKNRKETPQIVVVEPNNDWDLLKNQIKEAFKEIH